MCTGRLRDRVTTASPVGIAELIGYDLRFHKKSTDGSGKADAYSTGCQDHVIVGVLFEIESAEKPKLDRAKALCRGYEEAIVSVKGSEGNTWNPFTYLAQKSHIVPDLKPYSWYKRFVVEGAKQPGLPRWYSNQIQEAPDVHDTDTKRHIRYMKVEC